MLVTMALREYPTESKQENQYMQGLLTETNPPQGHNYTVKGDITVRARSRFMVL